MNTPLDAGVKATSTVMALIAEILNDFSSRLTYSSLLLLSLLVLSLLTFMKYLGSGRTEVKNINLTIPVDPSPRKANVATFD